MPPRLDHIIVLIPYAALLSPPSWITDNFTLTPGGRHADNKTENKLICFQDGSYIELISFIDDSPTHRAGHWWGDQEFGIIDFAFTHSDGTAATHFSDLLSRLNKLDPGNDVKVEYVKPVAGARLRPDGKEVKWEVTFPVVDTGYKRGELPFFCHDVTDRSLRVPLNKKNVDHPSGAYGLSEMSVFVPESRISALTQAYAAILDTKGADNGGAGFEVGRLHEVDGASGVKLMLKTAQENWQVKEIERRGGVLIGDMVIGGFAESGGKTVPKRRIDVERDESVGMGRISLAITVKKS